MYQDQLILNQCGDCLIADDFWLGLEKIYSLTQQGVYILRIDLEDWKEERHWAEYQFSLEGPSKDYIIHVTNFSGDLPDALANSTGMRFSTKDRNTDDDQHSSCNRSYTGRRPKSPEMSYDHIFPDYAFYLIH